VVSPPHPAWIYISGVPCWWVVHTYVSDDCGSRGPPPLRAWPARPDPPGGPAGTLLSPKGARVARGPRQLAAQPSTLTRQLASLRSREAVCERQRPPLGPMPPARPPACDSSPRRPAPPPSPTRQLAGLTPRPRRPPEEGRPAGAGPESDWGARPPSRRRRGGSTGHRGWHAGHGVYGPLA
jgi:hypothetical protein